jgi:hypothetical protein
MKFCENAIKLQPSSYYHKNSIPCSNSCRTHHTSLSRFNLELVCILPNWCNKNITQRTQYYLELVIKKPYIYLNYIWTYHKVRVPITNLHSSNYINVYSTHNSIFKKKSITCKHPKFSFFNVPKWAGPTYLWTIFFWLL